MAPIFTIISTPTKFSISTANCSAFPKKSARNASEEILDMVGLNTADRKRVIRTYSKGMMQRVGLAQALLNDPELLFLDEPTTGLDPIGARQMKDAILKVRDAGKTVLLCSHLLADVQAICDRVAILSRRQSGQIRHRARTGRAEPALSKFSPKASVKPLWKRRAPEFTVQAGKRPRAISRPTRAKSLTMFCVLSTMPTRALSTLKATRETLEDVFVRSVKSDGRGK